MCLNHDKLLAVAIGGALGDALGAPAEAVPSLEKILLTFGERGVEQLYPYHSPWEAVAQSGVGAITDDTTMAMTTLAAMIMASNTPEKLRFYTWQGYLNWGACQEGGEALAQHIDPSLAWPDEIRPFWFACGAGRGTIAALSTGKMGSQAEPLSYNTIIRGQAVSGLNDGCGGMMRAAALAFWPHQRDKYALGLENATLTHGAENAYHCTGFITALIGHALTTESVTEAFAATLDQTNASIWKSIATTTFQQGQQEGTFAGIDQIPKQFGIKNRFTSLSVFAQTLYALGASTQMTAAPSENFKRTLTLAVSHGGDSDSVGAIVGNVMGAAHGLSALPMDWVNKLQMQRQINALGLRAAPILNCT